MLLMLYEENQGNYVEYPQGSKKQATRACQVGIESRNKQKYPKSRKKQAEIVTQWV